MKRTDIINHLIELHGYKSYLEIGVYDGTNFEDVKAIKKVGVDPDKKTKATVFKTSDQFFDENIETFDIIFIDGLHHCEQVIRDVNNSLDFLNEGGTIVMHDCNPTTKKMQHVPRVQGEWTGDVWRAFLHFRSRPDLKMKVVDTDYGVGIISRGEQKPLIIKNPTYEEFAINKREWLNLVSPCSFTGKPLISVCIPAFEQYGHGVKNLNELFKTLEKQKGCFEVVVSDNSKDEKIHELCLSWQKSNLNIKYVHNEIIGISANTNNAIKHASCNLIKIMYMDDILIDDNAIVEFAEALKTTHWCTSYARAINEHGKPFRNHIPRWTPEVIMGRNSIGMPSMLGFRKNEFEFDTNLKTLLDCEYMWLLYRKFGPPKIIPKYLIGQRYWPNQTSHVQGNHKVTEWQYIKSKHNL